MSVACGPREWRTLSQIVANWSGPVHPFAAPKSFGLLYRASRWMSTLLGNPGLIRLIVLQMRLQMRALPQWKWSVVNVHCPHDGSLAHPTLDVVCLGLVFPEIPIQHPRNAMTRFRWQGATCDDK